MLIYLDREDKDEKTVERSPELSVGNGGELDLLEMEKSNFQTYVKLKPIRLQRESLSFVKLVHTLSVVRASAILRREFLTLETRALMLRWDNSF